MLVYFVAIWTILQPFGMFLGSWNISLSFGKFSPVLVCCSKKNLATMCTYIHMLMLVSLIIFYAQIAEI
jgi:hypothetical protein